MKKRFIIGLTLLILSYLIIPLLPVGLIKAGISYTLFSLGFILLFDYITLKIKNKSLINEVLKSKQNFILFLIFALISGLFLDGIGKWIGKLWVFPYATTPLYFLAIYPAYLIYWFLICESYLATKDTIDLVRKEKIKVTKPYRYERWLYNLLGILGIITVLLTSLRLYLNIKNQSLPFINLSNEVPKIINLYVPNFTIILLYLIGFFFIFEFIEYKRKETSLIKDIIHHYPSPLIAIIIGALIFGFIMETQNIFYNAWQYVNWPYEKIAIFGLPLSMFLLWILHYIFFLSLFRAITNKESSEIWKGNTLR